MAGKMQNISQWLHDPSSIRLEIIIVHDKGDEKTEIEIQQIVKGSPNKKIKMLTGVWESPGFARNVGLSIATGNYISFWDSDDLPNIDSVLQVIEGLSREVDIAVGQYLIKDSKDPNTIIYKSTDLTLEEVAFNPGIWRLIFRREFINKMTFSKERMGEDQEFIYNSLKRDPKVDFSNIEVYNYYINNVAQLTANPKEVRSLRRVILRLLSSMPSDKENFAFAMNIMIFRQTLTYFKVQPIIGLYLLMKFFFSAFKNLGMKSFLLLTKKIYLTFCKIHERQKLIEK